MLDANNQSRKAEAKAANSKLSLFTLAFSLLDVATSPLSVSSLQNIYQPLHQYAKMDPNLPNPQPPIPATTLAIRTTEAVIADLKRCRATPTPSVSANARDESCANEIANFIYSSASQPLSYGTGLFHESCSIVNTNKLDEDEDEQENDNE